MGIRDVLKDVADSYSAAKVESFVNNPVAVYLREEAPAVISSALNNSYFKVMGSPGQGQWADIPWIAVFDPNVTTSATSGQYVVYLFAADLSRVYLTIAQGTTMIREEFGRGTHDELSRRASLIRARLPERPLRFSDASVDLGRASTLARDYEHSVALSIEYDPAKLPAEETLTDDLVEIVQQYLKLTARGGVDPLDAAPDNETNDGHEATIVERRLYRLHRRIERNSRAAKAAKKIHGCICQACGFDFEAVYGEVGKGYIEAHHLTPLSELPEDKPVHLDPRHDFSVLCANCHRMMHRNGGRSVVDDLRMIEGVSKLRCYLKKS